MPNCLPLDLRLIFITVIPFPSFVSCTLILVLIRLQCGTFSVPLTVFRIRIHYVDAIWIKILMHCTLLALALALGRRDSHRYPYLLSFFRFSRTSRWRRKKGNFPHLLVVCASAMGVSHPDLAKLYATVRIHNTPMSEPGYKNPFLGIVSGSGTNNS